VSKIVHLFPDTNVFLQCRALEQLDWSAWQDADEVHVIVTRPVQTEIDDHKSKGNERRAKRARAASSMLRAIIRGGTDHLVVREAGPTVKLFINLKIRPSAAHADMLDYERPDDELVGTVQTFIDEHPEMEAYLLTDDVGPMASASMLGMPLLPVPEEWLLPPEPSEADREIRALKEEIARLKESEPHVTVACVNAHGALLDRLEFEQKRYEALTDADVSRLVGTLSSCFPLAKDFGPRERAERNPQHRGFSPFREVFTPVSDKEIQRYREEHATWLEVCESRLRNLHHALERQDGRPVLAFKAVNEGSRPATDVLLTLRVKGSFLIVPPARQDEKGEKGDPFKLLPPPKRPAGRWQPAPFVALGGLDMLERVHQLNSTFQVRPGRALDLDHLIARSPQPKDPNLFYYKPGRPLHPVAEFSLTCGQWRHGTDEELFSVEIWAEAGEVSVAGALECVIHAGNMSSPVTKLVPVRGRVVQQSSLPTAENMVTQLLAGSGA
jgi:hypothetical protein